MALNSNALCDVPTLRAHVTRNAFADTSGRLADDYLTDLINRASAAIEGWCDRTLIAPAEARGYVFDGPGGRRLVLGEWPIVTVEQVVVDELVIPRRQTATGLGWTPRPAEGWLELVGYTFTRGVGNVLVTARLGYDRTLAATERRHRRALDELAQACLLLAGLWFEQTAAGRLTGDAGTYAGEPWPAEVRGLLAPYRRLGG